MALQSLGSRLIWPDTSFRGTGAAVGSMGTLDAAGEYVAWVGQARESMVVSHFGFRCSTVAGSPTALVSIQTVDATTGLPNGLWAANTSGTSGTLSSNTWNLVALTASATIAVGDVFAAVVAYNSGTSLQPSSFSQGTLNISQFPYRVVNTGAPAPAAFQSTHAYALGSSSTTFYATFGMMAIVSVATESFANDASPPIRGLRFQIPFTGRCVGICHAVGSATGDYVVGLYSDAGSELSSSNTAVDGTLHVGTNEVPGYTFFDNPVTLSPDTWYRLRIAPSTTTATQIQTLTMPSADYRSTAGYYGNNVQYTTFSGAAWDDTNTTKLPMIRFLFDQLDDGVGGAPGGGGGAHILGGTVVR
jgi:hypothetical protein